jgi:hypothetical protein
MPNQSCPSCGNENPQGAGFCMSCGIARSASQPRPQPQHQQVELSTHSPLGVASFVSGLVSAVSFVILLALLAMERSGQVDPSDELLAFVVFGLVLFGSAAAALIALVFGILGLVQQQRNKLFAILGAVLSGAIGLALIVFVVSPL